MRRILAKRVDYIQPSQTLGITATVDTLRRQGKNIIDLGAGEPDFDTPELVKEAAITAIREGFTKYTPTPGILELKEAICEKYKRATGQSYDPAQVLISNGAKHSIMNVLFTLCDEGDEVIIPAPYWTSYIEQVRFIGARPVVLKTTDEGNFKVTPKQLRNALTEKTKVFMLNSPHNPTGSVYSEVELRALVNVLKEHDVRIIFDEIYEKIVYDAAEHVSLACFSEIRDQLVLINGMSKSFAMTGWRIGYMVAHPDIVKACSKIQSHMTSNACSISQRASVAALHADEGVFREMLFAFNKRRKYFYQALISIPDVKCVEPKGAFYLYPNVSAYFGSRYGNKAINNAMDLATFLLQEEGVAVVPGEAFGSTENIRLSYATSMQNIEEAVARLERALSKLVRN